MNAETIARLSAIPMPARSLREVLVIVAELLDEARPEDAISTVDDTKRRARNARYRERLKASQASYQASQEASQEASHGVSGGVSQASQPPPPPSPPLHPPSPSVPACTPVPQVPACAGKPEPELILETETNPTPKKEKLIRTGTSGKANRIAEAKNTTRDIRIPKDLESPEFREAWGEWCAHRERLAADDARKPWTMSAASNCLRQCQDKGEAWALVEIRFALANSYVGLLWEQRRNPADVRSQPMLPGHKPEAGSVKKLMTEISRSRSPVPKVAPGERATPADIAKAKAELNGQPP